MERSILMETMEDADTLFLIAKDRLLDINHWSTKASINISLTDQNRQKQNRNAHAGDFIKVDSGKSMTYWMRIQHIIYDKYPDSNSEQLTMSINKTIPSFDSTNDNAQENVEQIIIRRINHSVSAIAEAGKNDQIFTQELISVLLSSFISIEEYEVH